MRGLVLATVLAMAGAGVAVADAAMKPAKAERPHLVICDKDGMAQRALRREHGAVVWTNSAEVLAAVRAGQGWSTPRCISNLEYARVEDAVRRMQRAEAARSTAQRPLASR